MQAYLRIGEAEHVLEFGPLARQLRMLDGFLDPRARVIYDALARIDRERARGGHPIDRGELAHLVTCAYGLCADPPQQLRRARRLDGPHPAAGSLAALLAFLRAHPGDGVTYDLYPR